MQTHERFWLTAFQSKLCAPYPLIRLCDVSRLRFCPSSNLTVEQLGRSQHEVLGCDPWYMYMSAPVFCLHETEAAYMQPRCRQIVAHHRRFRLLRKCR